MSGAQNDLLQDLLFRVTLADGESRRLSLSGVFASSSDPGIELASFDGLTAWQEEAWFRFLVQVGALALLRAAQDKPPVEEHAWRELLTDLGEDQPQAWRLVVDDLGKPGFLQPPVPEGTLDALKRTVETPDGLDVLVTSKNHDVKLARISDPSAAQWAFALVSMQTCSGFGGRGNYGIMRMNGGFGNRPVVATYARADFGTRFRRDLELLLRAHDDVASRYGFASNRGIALSWLEPWDGKSSLTIDQLDPWAIELSRRVRLVPHRNLVLARLGATQVARIQVVESKGDVGDPWTPIMQDGKALTVSGRGFDYSLVCELLLGGDYDPPLAMTHPATAGGTFFASTLARGQGTTEGFHERVVPVPAKVMSWLFARESDERRALQELAQNRVQQVGLVRSKVLYPCLRVLLDGGESHAGQDDRPSRWLDRFKAQVDEHFFELLWSDLELDLADANRRWEVFLQRTARRVLDEAIKSVPLPGVRRYRAIAAAEGLFSGSIHKQLPNLPKRFKTQEAPHA